MISMVSEVKQYLNEKLLINYWQKYFSCEYTNRIILMLVYIVLNNLWRLTFTFKYFAYSMYVVHNVFIRVNVFICGIIFFKVKNKCRQTTSKLLAPYIFISLIFHALILLFHLSALWRIVAYMFFFFCFLLLLYFNVL